MLVKTTVTIAAICDFAVILIHILHLFNPNSRGGGGAIILLHRRIAFSPQPNIRRTQDQSVNSSLSVVVQ